MTRTSHRHLTRWSVLWIMCVLVLPAFSCNTTEVKPLLTAAQRLEAAAEILAPRIGADAKDVAQGFRTKFAGLSEEEIASQAERAAEQTAWIDSIFTRIAQDKVKIGKVVRGAACDWIKVSNAYAKGSDAEYKAWIGVIEGHMTSEGLSMSPDEFKELAKDVWDQVQAFSQQGSFDPGRLSTDLICLEPTGDGLMTE
jgi:hypothetical protein